jgi:hypothetical protein
MMEMLGLLVMDRTPAPQLATVVQAYFDDEIFLECFKRRGER